MYLRDIKMVKNKVLLISKMKKSDARVTIARDVLKRLRAKQFIAKHGEYVTWSLPYGSDLPMPTFKNGSSLREQLKEAPPCKVCALGAAFISAVDKFNKCDVSDSLFDDPRYRDQFCETKIKIFLKRFFTQSQLAEIEAAFEGWHSSREYADRLGAKHNYDNLPKDYEKTDIRLAMIMKNIIRHKGTFVAAPFIRRLETKGYYKKV